MRLYQFKTFVDDDVDPFIEEYEGDDMRHALEQFSQLPFRNGKNVVIMITEQEDA